MSLSVSEFLDRLESSDILDAAAFAAVRSSVSDDDLQSDAEPFVKKLHKKKTLTNYQVQALWKGKGHKLTFGNYVIESELGRGGMGVVLKARHKRMQRHVAIKVLPTAMTKDTDAIARFQREVIAAAQLTHTNIVGAFDADEVNGQHILVMEFVDGRDLSEVIKKKGPLKIPQAVDYMAQAARGLEFAHRQGVIHRDIKPANLLLATDGTVKILDMGLARMAESADVGTQAELTGTGTVMGTVDYMSPEQAMSTKSADERSDIYSLGISLFFLLTAKPVYEGDSLMARLMAHANQPIPSLREARPDVPEAVQQVFEKMVAKDAGQRYQTMTEVVAALEASLTDAPVSNTSPDPSAFAQTGAVGRNELSQFLSGIDASSTASDLSVTEARVSPDSAENTIITGGGASDTLLSGLPPATQAKRKGGGGRKKKRQQWYEDKRILGAAGAALVVLLGLFLLPGDDPKVKPATAQAVPSVPTTTADPVPSTTRPMSTTSALRFSGDDRVDIPGLNLDGSEPFTFEIKLHHPAEATKGASGQIPIARVGGLFSLYRKNWGHKAGWEMAFMTEERLTQSNERVGGSRPIVTPSLSSHMAIIYDKKTFRVFVDGQPNDGKPLLFRGDGGTYVEELPDLTAFQSGTKFGTFESANEHSSQFEISEIRISNTVRYTQSYEPQARLENDEHTVALYDFHEGSGDILHDITGNGHDGKIIGAKWVSVTSAQTSNRDSPQTGLLFDKPETHVDVGKIPLDLTKPFTAELWCRPSVLRPADGWVSSQTAFTLGLFTLKLERSRNAEQARVAFNAVKSNEGAPGSSETSGAVFASPYSISAGGLMNITVEWTGDEAHLYLDGKRLQRATAVYGKPRPDMLPFLHSLHNADESHNLALGGAKRDNPAEEHFDGEIYQFRLSRGTRFNADFTPVKKFDHDAKTAVLFDFQEGTGDILKDSSGNGHDGKIIEAEWVKGHDSVGSDSAAALPQQTPLEFSQPGDHVEIPDVDLNLKEPFTAEIWCTPEISSDADNPLRVAFELGPVQLKLAEKSPRVGNRRRLWEWNVLAYDYMRGDDGGLVTATGGNLNAKIKRTHIAIQWDGRAQLVFIDGQPAPRGDFVAGSKKPAAQIWQELLASATKAAVAIGQPIGEGRPRQSWRGTIDGFRLSKGKRYSGSFVPESHLRKDAQTKLLYHFSEGSGNILHDSSGNGHDGKIIGAKWVRSGNSELRLQETNAAEEARLRFEPGDGVEIESLIDETESLTMELWLEADEILSHIYLLGPHSRYFLGIENREYSFKDRFDPKVREVRLLDPDVWITPKKLTHLAFVRDAQEDEIRLYVDGKLFDKFNEAGQPTDGKFQVCGTERQYSAQKGNGFRGVLDEIRISSSVRYKGERFTPQRKFETDQETLALYHFDEGAGDVLHDSSGNDHHGKIIGAKWVSSSVAEQASEDPPPAIAPFAPARAKAHQEAWAKHLDEPVVTTNSVDMQLAIIPPGKFTMGSPESEAKREPDETQVDVVLTKPFRVSVHEVTQGQWKAVTGTEPWKGQKEVQEGDQIPVTWVNWDETNAFCHQLTERERGTANLPDGWQYRLPTAAEWEWSCRAGTMTAFSFGDDESQLGEYAWYLENAKNAGEVYAHAVGLKKPNPWGLHDVHGNVREWCSDWYDSELSGGRDPQGPFEGTYRIFRSGSWDYTPWRCRSALRDRSTPSLRYSNLGFRVVLSPIAGVPSDRTGSSN